MSWGAEDLREDILTLFAEVQAPWQSALVNEIIRLIGCQRLKDSAAKLKWAAANKAKQKEYAARHWQRNKERIMATRRAQREASV